MVNDSSQAGYLRPQAFGGVEDITLHSFLQSLVAGITGMDGKFVFQRWQPEPPNWPAFGKDWAAVGEASRVRDTFANVVYRDELAIVYRNSIISVLCSFYGPNAQANCEILAMGFFVAQNREQMTLQGFGYVDQEDSIATADYRGTRWIPRIDLPFRLRRAQAYSYSVLDLKGARVAVNPSEGSSGSILVTPPLPMFGWGWDNELISGWGTGKWTP
jgi:hypothetical protein